MRSVGEARAPIGVVRLVQGPADGPGDGAAELGAGVDPVDDLGGPLGGAIHVEVGGVEVVGSPEKVLEEVVSEAGAIGQGGVAVGLDDDGDVGAGRNAGGEVDGRSATGELQQGFGQQPRPVGHRGVRVELAEVAVSAPDAVGSLVEEAAELVGGFAGEASVEVELAVPTG